MSNLTLWTRDPFAQFDALVREAFGPVPTRPAVFSPAAELARDGVDAVIRLELPGIDPAADVNVEVDRGRLLVHGQRRDARPADAPSLREVRYGSFRRTFRLPAHVTADAVSASYDAGVLSIRLAGAYAGADPKRIPVTVPAAEQPQA